MDTPIIKNIDELATSKLKEDALDILETGYESIAVDRLIRSQISLKDNNICIADQKICLDDYEKVYFIAIGKCAVASATVFEDLLGDRIANGIVLDVKEGEFKHVVSEAGTHPLPSDKNVVVTKSIVDILKQATKKDIILTLISGGGSSLMCLPYKISCDDQSKLSHELMKKGATISELNTVRKHTSSIKGGQFAKLAYPSKVVSFILSDVPGDDLSVIASGPTVMDKTTVKDAEAVLKKYDMKDTVESLKIELTETPKKEKYFQNVNNILLGSNLIALEAMKRKAEELGYNTYIEDTKLEGDAQSKGEEFISKEYLPKSCHIWGGETTVTVKGNGKGGRNQEFVLGALSYLPENIVVAGVASDGWDNSNVAGALADRDLLEKSLDEGLDSNKYLEENDSYNFFEKVGGHIKTGRTGSNVADWYLIIKGDIGDISDEE